jgi:hypothetical protein
MRGAHYPPKTFGEKSLVVSMMRKLLFVDVLRDLGMR